MPGAYRVYPRRAPSRLAGVQDCDADDFLPVVAHGVGEYVRNMAHTNGMESFWSLLKRGYIGIYQWMSIKHMDRYVTEFEGRHNGGPMEPSPRW